MNTIDTIKKRKSIRKFQETALDKDTIETVTMAGHMAAGTPMAGKTYLHAISNKEILNEIKNSAKEVMTNSGVEMLVKMASNPNFNPLYNAPLGILISIDKTENSQTRDMAIANAACAGENILICATDLGLGSCFVESPILGFKNKALSTKIGLDENIEPICMILVGHSEDKTPHKEYEKNPETVKYIN